MGLNASRAPVSHHKSTCEMRSWAPKPKLGRINGLTDNWSQDIVALLFWVWEASRMRDLCVHTCVDCTAQFLMTRSMQPFYQPYLSSVDIFNYHHDCTLNATEIT